MADDLKQDKTDALVATVKSVLGTVPFAGPLLSELVGNLIPNQRVDRLTNYVKELEARLSRIDREKIDNALRSEEGIDLFEEGFVQASRSLTDERRKYVANVVANGVDDETIEYSESKYILKLLQELNEQEIIWLRFFMVPTIGGDEEFRGKHRNILEPVPAHLGSDERTIEKASLQDSYKGHLEHIGLIRPHYRMDRNTGMPEFDKFSGKPSVSYRDLTPIGRMILKQIGFTDYNNG
ncbi:hypothetical protein AGRI_14490 [Alishewanella agri BL06]|uniref:Uncharacterized protein n=1 Tax=Alishewanella agri BL06 TaxID=1195246 RepID=I9NYT2_9ALTE|nr:hypothetical protein [Alishewanella agri]EIW87737.1 hypothetical protein AGRI_14490 [Alishewanella agri BL06]